MSRSNHRKPDLGGSPTSEEARPRRKPDLGGNLTSEAHQNKRVGQPRNKNTIFKLSTDGGS